MSMSFWFTWSVFGLVATRFCQIPRDRTSAIGLAVALGPAVWIILFVIFVMEETKYHD